MKNTLALLFSILVSLGGPLYAADGLKKTLASELYDTTVAVQAAPIIDRLLLSAQQQAGLSDAALKIYRASLLELLSDPEYRSAYVEAYVANFTLEELQALLELAKHPGFALYLQKSQAISEATTPVFVRLMNRNRAEVERRIREAGEAPQ